MQTLIGKIHFKPPKNFFAQVDFGGLIFLGLLYVNTHTTVKNSDKHLLLF